ncbi:MAG: four-carbon acid sugar kinase family protein, partial [Mangrovicoccus sp.]
MTAPIPDGKSDLPSGPLVAWYGDDFTGAGAVMEVLAFAGLEAVLFTDIPTAEELARFPKAQGIGIASTARAQTPAWMVKHLPKAFDALKQTGAPVLHYKTCSTLDSAPHIGSIGCAMDIAAREIPSPWVPILLAAPTMRRYQAFGHLFASAPEGVFRLDRHPVMAHHPVTPMAESDVAAHLRRQTDLPLGCVTLEDLAGDPTQAVAGARAAGLHGLSLDAISDTHMAQLGQLIWQEPDSPLFAVGSQGVEYALVAYWQLAGLLAPPPAPKSAGEVERMVAVSGSVSPVTAAQIAWA